MLKKTDSAALSMEMDGWKTRGLNKTIQLSLTSAIGVHMGQTAVGETREMTRQRASDRFIVPLQGSLHSIYPWVHLCILVCLSTFCWTSWWDILEKDINPVCQRVEKLWVCVCIQTFSDAYPKTVTVILPPVQWFISSRKSVSFHEFQFQGQQQQFSFDVTLNCLAILKYLFFLSYLKQYCS